MKVKFLSTGEVAELPLDYARELIAKKIAVCVGLPDEAIPHEQVSENEMRTIKENTMIRHRYVE